MEDCTRRECVKTQRAKVWKESFSNATCCSFQRTGFKVGEEIKSLTAVDGCTQVSLLCSNQMGAPDVAVRVQSSCGAATEESMLENFAAVTEILQHISDKTG